MNLEGLAASPYSVQRKGCGNFLDKFLGIRQVNSKKVFR